MSRPFGNWIKENLVLVAGVSLPVLLILFFMLAKVIPEKAVADPKHKAVIALQSYNSGYNFSFKVKDGKLNVTYTAPKDVYDNGSREESKILIYDGATGEAESITLEIPENAIAGKAVDIKLPRLDKLTLSNSETAPDGYMFQREGYRNSSFVAEIFSYNNRRTPHSLTKDGRIITIAPLKDRYYGDVNFIGWVMEE